MFSGMAFTGGGRMGLHQRNKRQLRFGLAELVALLLVLLALAPALLYWRASLEPAWRQTVGTVVASSIDPVEYSRDPRSRQVELTYEYTAHGQSFTGNWQGFWPQVHSPNALPHSQMDRLKPGHTLKVYFDPVQPSENLLHYTGSIRPATYGRITMGALVLVLAYFVAVYPRWRHG